MEMPFLAMTAAALGLGILSLVVASVAYWRAGGRHDLEVLKQKQRMFSDELSRRIRAGYDDSIARVRRSQERIAELRRGATSALEETLDVLGKQLAEIKADAELGLHRLATGVTEGAQATEEAVAKRMRRVEARIHVLLARAEMVRAEKLAERQQFIQAEQLLEDAVEKVRQVNTRLHELDEDPSFTDLVVSLRNAILAVRAEARDYKQQIERVLNASDTLLTNMAAREPAHTH